MRTMMLSILLLGALLPVVRAAEPDRMTIPELEAAFGKNILEPDPAGLGPPPGVPDDTVLRRWFGDSPRSMNSYVWGDANLIDSLIVTCCLDFGLRHRDDPNRWAPGAADFCAATPDLSSVVVRLRPGLRWQFPALERDDPRHAWLVELFEQDPPELTAADVKFTLDTILNPEADLSLRSAYQGSSIEPLGRYTFRMSWDRFYIYAMEYAISWQQILPEFLFSRDEDGRRFTAAELGAAIGSHWCNNRLCGYGPYEFVGMDPDVRIVLKRKDDFPVFRPAIAEIDWEITSGGEVTLLRLLDDQLDYTVLMPQQYRSYVLEADADSPFKNGKFEVKPYEKAEYIFLGWNCRREPFADARVRNALGRAFNREAFLKNVYFDCGALVDSHVFYRHPHYNPNLEPLAFDPKRASAELDAAGWGDADGDGVRDKMINGRRHDFRFSMLSFAGSTEFDTVFSIYKDDLKKIGVDLTVEPVTWPVMQQRAFKDHDFDAFVGLLGLGWEVDFYSRFHSEGGTNYSGFSDPEADELIVRYRETVADDQRQDLAFHIQEIIHREQPCSFFLRRNRLTVYQPWLENVEYAVARPQLCSFGWYRSN